MRNSKQIEGRIARVLAILVALTCCMLLGFHPMTAQATETGVPADMAGMERFISENEGRLVFNERDAQIAGYESKQSPVRLTL